MPVLDMILSMISGTCENRMSIDPKYIEHTADVLSLDIFFQNGKCFFFFRPSWGSG